MSSVDTTEDFVIVAAVASSGMENDFEIVEANEDATAFTTAGAGQEADVEQTLAEGYVFEEGKWLSPEVRPVVPKACARLTTKQAASRVRVLSAVSRHLAGHTQDASCLAGPKCALCASYTDGLELLFKCNDEWHSTAHTFAATTAYILNALHTLPLAKQYHFYTLLLDVLGSYWTEQVDSVFTDGYWKLPLVLWVLYLGPRGLASSLGNGATIQVILKDAEQVWHHANSKDYRYEDNIELLESFAVGLRRWGADLKLAGAGGVE